MDKMILDTLGYETCIRQLEKIIGLKMTIGLDFEKEFQLKKQLEKEYSEDFWSGWKDYEKEE